LKPGIIAGAIGFVLSLIIALASGAGGLAFLRALISGVVFFAVVELAYLVLKQIMPDMFEGIAPPPQNEADDGTAPPGQQVNISINDDYDAAAKTESEERPPPDEGPPADTGPLPDEAPPSDEGSPLDQTPPAAEIPPSEDSSEPVEKKLFEGLDQNQKKVYNKENSFVPMAFETLNSDPEKKQAAMSMSAGISANDTAAHIKDQYGAHDIAKAVETIIKHEG
jgi:hypothetical protein